MDLGCLKAVCFGNFSGKSGERDSLDPLELSPNTWESVWQSLNPRLDMVVDLPRIDSIPIRLHFAELKDFKEKTLVKAIPILKTAGDLKDLVGSTNVENLLSSDNPIFREPEIKQIRNICGNTKSDDAVVDLLNMVDIGENEESGLGLKHLGQMLDNLPFDGKLRDKVLFDLEKLERSVLGQVFQNRTFQELQASWYCLKKWAERSSAMKLDVVDCDQSELCDAFYLNYVRPDVGEPRPVDLAFTLYSFDQGEDARHQLYYLGKMAESLSVPYLANAAVELFGVTSEKRLNHIQDFSGKFSRPEYAKWRKLRDEPGSQWIFVFVNTYTVASGEHKSWIPASAWGAQLIHYLLKAETWPGELLGPIGRMDYGEAVRIEWTPAQVNDLGYNGFSTINKEGDALRLSAMMSLSSLKIPSHAQASAAALVPFTLPYRFFAGLCARTYVSHDEPGTLEEKLKKRFGLKDEDIKREEGDEGPILRISAPFGIMGVKPDFLIG